MTNEVVMTNDYVLANLIEDRDFFDSRKNGSTAVQTLNRRIVSYMKCLIFAISWDKLHDSVDIDISRKVYNQLFFSQSSNNYKSFEPGEYARLLKDVCNDARQRGNFKDDINLLYQLGVVRNSAAHVDVSLWKDENTEEVNKAISEFNKLFDHMDTAYLLPTENKGSYMSCWMVKKDEKYPLIDVHCPIQKDDRPLDNSLLYRVTDTRTGKGAIYSLSPFIHMTITHNGKNSAFWMYAFTINNGYGSGFHKLSYESVFSNENDIFDSCECDVQLQSLFPKKIISEDVSSSLWIPSHYNNMKINISSYPGFEEIRKGKFLFCVEICANRGKVRDFCRNDAKQVCVVYGNGGLGKTALVLSIIDELFTESDNGKNKYEYLIFLSAKGSYYSFESEVSVPYKLEDYRDKSDIHSYNELLDILSKLLRIAPEEDKDLAKVIFDVITNSKRQYLLIIDDLDSLPLEDQSLIQEFVYNFPATSLKTIITTRKDYSGQTPVSFAVTQLDEKQSLSFAAWYYNIRSKKSWDEWDRKGKASTAVIQYGDGSPLQIKMLITLFLQGYNPDFYNYNATKKERAIYLYKTIHNFLSDEQKLVFEIGRRLISKLPAEYQERELRIDLLRYLCVGVGIDNDRFRTCWEMLFKLLLVNESSNQMFFSFFSPFVLDQEIVQVSGLKIPKMYKSVFEEIGKNIDEFAKGIDIESKLVNCLLNLEDDKNYDSAVVIAIFEAIQEKNKNEGVLSIIEKYIQSHNLDNEQGQALRLKEQVKMAFSAFETAYNEDNFEEYEKASSAFLSAINEAESFMEEHDLTEMLNELHDIRRKAREFEE